MWVSGPAGAGKTSLVSTWLEARERPFLWYRLDAGDGDVGTFFDGLASAVDGPPRPHPELPPLGSPSLNDHAQTGRQFFQVFFADRPRELVLVFDDYQEIGEGSPFHAVMKGALAELSHAVLVICISREEPPRMLARCTAGAAFCRVTAEGLRLSDDEARALPRALGDGLRRRTFGSNPDRLPFFARARGRVTETATSVCSVCRVSRVHPLEPAVLEEALRHELIMTVEDVAGSGALAREIAYAVASAARLGADGSLPKVRAIASPSRFLPRGARSELLHEFGITASQVASAVHRELLRASD